MTRRQTTADIADELRALPVGGVFRLGSVAVRRDRSDLWRVVTPRVVVPTDRPEGAAYIVVMEAR